jgi:signal transduction histidine kinase
MRREPCAQAGSAELLAPPEETQLAQINQLSFRRLIETTADGVLVVDLSGAVLYANPAAEEIFGHSKDELLNIPLGRPVASGETAELTVRRPGKKPAEVEMRVVEFAWDGRPAILASLRDISARRAHEERQRQSQKLEAVGRLSAGLVHDLNNLLGVFDAGLRLLRKQIAEDPADPKVDMLIEEMLRRAKTGGALTQQLLAFSRRQSLTPTAVDLNARIDSLTNLLERTLGGGVKIERKLDAALGPVLIDANQLDAAILNLAVNGRDAMGGQGLLTIETSNAPSDFEDLPSAADGYVRVTVADTGSGMSEDVLAQAFEPFFTTKGEGEGTGLGLSQVYGFVHQSGGQVRIDSEVGAGTRVHLFLPRAPAGG